MSENIEAQNDVAPQRQHPGIHQPELELMRQLGDGHKIVDLQDESGTFLMMLDTLENREISDESLRESGYNEVGNRLFVTTPLGHGGFGMVYTAESNNEKFKKLCIKMALHKRRYENDRDRQQGQEKINRSLIKEAKHYKKLSQGKHANIITMCFFCKSRDFREVFLALELCDGVNIAQLIRHYRRKHLPSKILYKIMVECTRAVEYCLSRDIVHCDIKPSNVMFPISRMEQPLKLIDFGCAVDISKERPVSKYVGGTTEYMAPEMIFPDFPDIKKSSDIYGLGSLFFHLITRRAPWYHILEIRSAWKGRNRKEVSTIIKREHSHHNEVDPSRSTQLQVILKESNIAHLSKYQDECKLIARMLTFDHRERPSCEAIVENVEMVCKKSYNRGPENFEEQDVPSLPLVFDLSSGGTGSGRLQTTISTSGKRLLEGGGSSTVSDQSSSTDATAVSAEAEQSMEVSQSFPAGDEDDIYSYGPLSDDSPFSEEMREDYREALNEEEEVTNIQMEGLRRRLAELQARLFMGVAGWEMLPEHSTPGGADGSLSTLDEETGDDSNTLQASSEFNTERHQVLDDDMATLDAHSSDIDISFETENAALEETAQEDDEAQNGQTRDTDMAILEVPSSHADTVEDVLIESQNAAFKRSQDDDKIQNKQTDDSREKRFRKD